MATRKSSELSRASLTRPLHEEEEEEEERCRASFRTHARMMDVASKALSDPMHALDRSGVSELCQYIQQLESEKRDLQDQVNFHRDQDATHRVQLAAAARRIEKLETSCLTVSDASDIQEESARQLETALNTERERGAQMEARLESMQRKWEDTERARQHAVFKFSELQTTMGEAQMNRLTKPVVPKPQRTDERDPTTGSSERIEKYKREIELLRQKIELRDDQANEKQRLAVELALRSAHLEHSAMLEKVRLECEIKLSEWRHDEAVRAKEIEAAMEEDRYSIRLEMKHGMQRAQIDQRVYYLQAQAAIVQQQNESTSQGTDEEVPFGAMDEVLVRMQLELLRTRRFGALKKLVLIRQSKVDRALRIAVSRWKLHATQIRIFQLNAVLHMHRIVTHLEMRKQRAYFHNWKAHTKLMHLHASQQQAVACWNRMLAVERLRQLLHERTLKQALRAFHRWRASVLQQRCGTATGSSGMATSSTTTPSEQPSEMAPPIPTGDTASASQATVTAGAELQEEIKKLHEQLASSKSEAWRYKRQLLKQFL
ncbi:hypothetical protein Poli38472_004197 [Pythium oligandrum]|uniref:Uncharacterized protein n=1 Tax=Pythium oligandrum TaxID=41045 RepID=A0A8K1CPU3_PYTOL|nr:hypothetical protein Poli38472_004197 [Pythium oligandrum]|eukprot:TMW66432.1 hypothetical protein Poli38472_004197 [Pythium oligandrum]